MDAQCTQTSGDAKAGGSKEALLRNVRKLSNIGVAVHVSVCTLWDGTNPPAFSQCIFVTARALRFQ
jgi:hypothetical protein